jgi:predicted metal-dependent phosphoesterase TrpH
VKKALSSGVTTLGLTDHDSIAGWTEAITAVAPQIELALGAEISCLTPDGISVHMLGLLFDGEHKEMQQMLEDSRIAATSAPVRVRSGARKTREKANEILASPNLS